MWIAVFQTTCVVVVLLLAAGSLLNLSRHPHWFIRSWDFPRVQIIVLGVLAAAVYLILEAVQHGNQLIASWSGIDSVPPATALFLIVWHGCRILPYTLIGRRQVLEATAWDDSRRLRLVISNVQAENEKYQRWMEVVTEADPDVVIAVEVNEVWMEAIRALRDKYRWEVAQPQENYYGMLVLSRLPLSDTEVKFLVQEDVPSIHTTVTLASGVELRLCAVHPRPPEPLRDENGSHRDAELVLLARELEDRKLPTVVGGDLNDVAWSYTTRLFLRISRLLDPRRGRGFFNTFHADWRAFRYPLDHVFHSPDFTLRALRRLPHVGSDHFPMLFDAQYEPSRREEQPVMEMDEEHEEVAEDMVEREEDEENERLADGDGKPLHFFRSPGVAS